MSPISYSSLKSKEKTETPDLQTGSLASFEASFARPGCPDRQVVNTKQRLPKIRADQSTRGTWLQSHKNGPDMQKLKQEDELSASQYAPSARPTSSK